MKEKKHEEANYFPRLPFMILAISGVIMLAANVIMLFVLDEYPKVLGIGMFAAYSLSAILIIIVQTAKYNYINEVNLRTAAFNTQVMDMFKYVTDIPYAIIDVDGNAVIVNNAMQILIGEKDRPIYNRPLSEFCLPAEDMKKPSFGGEDPIAADPVSVPMSGKYESGTAAKNAFDIIKSTIKCHGETLMKVSDASDIPNIWSYKLEPSGGVVVIGERHYEPRAHEIMVNGNKYYFTVFTDIEDIIEFRDRMEANNTVVAYIVPDNLQQIDKNMQSVYRDAAAKLESTLRRFARSIDGYLREYERDKYMLVFTHEKLEECRESNYRILSDVRAINVSDSISDNKGSDVVLTVSIGIADINDTMRRREEMAKNALELAIRRGGDQIVTHTTGETEFYGGQVKETTGNTIIDAKNTASQVWHYIHESESVCIMGHSFPDFDSIASCIGLARVSYDILSKKAGDTAYNDVYKEDNVRKERESDLEKLRDRAAEARRIAELSVRNKIKVVVDKGDANFTAFYEMLMNYSSAENREFYKKLFVSGNAAPDSIPKGSTLILSDVSNYAITESPELIDKLDNIIIIDHHRSATFKKEPIYKFIKSGASSASEIIASMIEHGNADIKLTKAEATLMLTGIMLDTNKFSRNTTDLTFAAAQYLIRCEADQDEARKFFLDKYSVYEAESRILGTDVEIYKGIAIARLDIGREFTGDDRIAASKAADRLITIRDINAAFALTKAGDIINISARSNGKINVQRLAERLGGGGHYNMAGAQLRDIDLKSVSEDLKRYIDEYLSTEAKGRKKI